jgi:DNA modification methylase
MAGAWPVQITQRELATITPYARNPRQNDNAVEGVARSIKEFGFQQPIVVDSAGVIVIGHTRYKAAQWLGLVSVPVHVADDLSVEQITALRIADNSTGEAATWDMDLLPIELASLRNADYDIAETGLDPDLMAGLLDPKPATVTEDEVPEPPVEPITKPGDLWLLGEHRLLCGDSTNAEHVKRLMAGESINIAFTSPPYASQRKYDESSGFKPIPPDQFVEWFKPIAANVKELLAPDGSWFVNIKPACEGLSRLTYVFDLVLAHVRDWGWNFAEEFCWERNGIPQRVVRRFKNNFEPVYQFTKAEWKFRPNAVRHKSQNVPVPKGAGAGDTNAAKRQGTGECAVSGNEMNSGMAYPSNRLPPFQSEALGHSAAFPVGLPSFFIKAYTDEGDSIYEPFCGSGTTLIAAEQLGRKCFGMEISPAYCDVIVKRWENLTGRTAELIEQ